MVELVAGSKTPDSGVQNAMLRALYEVISKAGSNMSEASRNAILGLIDNDAAGLEGNGSSENACQRSLMHNRVNGNNECSSGWRPDKKSPPNSNTTSLIRYV